MERIARAADEARQDRPALRARLGLPANAVIVQFVGKLTAQKHVDQMLHLARHLRGTSAHIMIVGSGPLEQTLRTRAAALRLNSVTFLGFVNQSGIAQVDAAGDVFVLPSEGEAWGLAVNEAMAAGVVPVISSEVGAAADLITQAVTGFVFPFGDWQAMADHVARLVTDHTLRNTMATAARSRVRGYGYDVASAGILDCLEALDLYRPPVLGRTSTEFVHVRH